MFKAELILLSLTGWIIGVIDSSPLMWLELLVALGEECHGTHGRLKLPEREKTHAQPLEIVRRDIIGSSISQSSQPVAPRKNGLRILFPEFIGFATTRRLLGAR